ncbi:lamB porin family protein, partial [Vibrio harveyi]
KLV